MQYLSQNYKPLQIHQWPVSQLRFFSSYIYKSSNIVILTCLITEGRFAFYWGWHAHLQITIQLNFTNTMLTYLQKKITDYLRNRNWNYNIIQLQIFLEKLILYVNITLFVIFRRPAVDCKRDETYNQLYKLKVWSPQTKPASLSYHCFFNL